MRDKGEILSDALDARNKATVSKRYPEQISLLTLEVFVDIRDILNTKTEQIAADITAILDSL